MPDVSNHFENNKSPWKCLKLSLKMPVIDYPDNYFKIARNLFETSDALRTMWKMLEASKIMLQLGRNSFVDHFENL